MYKRQELNEPPKLTVLEEVGNAVTHGIGAGLAIAGFVLLLLKSDTGLKVIDVYKRQEWNKTRGKECNQLKIG